MLENFSIKSKLSLVIFVTILGFVLLVLFNQFSSATIKNVNSVKFSIEELEIKLTHMKELEKEFFLSKDLKYVKSFNHTYKDMHLISKSIKDFIIDNDFNTDTIDKYIQTSKEFSETFKDFVDIQKIIGLNPKDGLYGKLRSSVHKVQDTAKKLKNYELLSRVYDLRKQEKDFMLRKDLKYLKKFNTKIDSLLGKDKLLSKDLIIYLKEYKEYFNTLVDKESFLGLNHNNGLKKKMIISINNAQKALDDILEESDKALTSMSQKLNYANYAITLILILVIVFILISISKNIINSINNLQIGLVGFFKYLNKESPKTELLKITGKDEISNMAVIINDNIKKIEINLEIDKEIIKETIYALSEYEKGDFSLKINKVSSNNELNDLTSIINQMANNLEHNIDNILAVFDKFSNNDYTQEVSTSGIKAHLHKLACGVNDLGLNISSLLSKSYKVGISLESSSEILLSNVDVLNNSSNVAASSLEETAAALEEITSTIVNNTQNVNQISEYSKSLNFSAKAGQKLAQNTTTSMDEITDQVNLINEAISLIDKISFQTNILSLNAAVEAATAGEAGKGFAVVAQEVRNLASSSAQAAKDIKELVENATQKAKEGKNASDEMIKGYSSLLNDIKKSSEKIEEITRVSKEQENGIIQINDAINKLDQQTQNNASIANKTKDIAVQTDEIAKEIVADAKSKKFIGKDKIN